MNCKYFGSCASCTLYDKNYDEQLNYKIQREKNRFSNLTTFDFDIIKSTPKILEIELNLEFGGKKMSRTTKIF